MRTLGWLLIALIWLLPLALFWLFPYDLHGQTGGNLFFYQVRDTLVLPGLWLGGLLDSLTNTTPTHGASPWAYLAGIALWLGGISALIYRLCCRPKR